MAKLPPEFIESMREIAESYSQREHARRLALTPEKLSREETAEYLTDISWEECSGCRGVGCSACNGEGTVWS